jgi:hypothetical protein
MAECLINHKVGKKVNSLILKSMLVLPINIITHSEYYFCPDPDCPVVYYSADNEQVFTEADLRERVYQKHPKDDDVFVCYCFKHKVGDIRKDVGEHGVSEIVEQINKGVQANQCACDILNPQESCCLGNVRKLVKSMQSE